MKTTLKTKTKSRSRATKSKARSKLAELGIETDWLTTDYSHVSDDKLSEDVLRRVYLKFLPLTNDRFIFVELINRFNKRCCIDRKACNRIMPPDMGTRLSKIKQRYLILRNAQVQSGR